MTGAISVTEDTVFVVLDSQGGPSITGMRYDPVTHTHASYQLIMPWGAWKHIQAMAATGAANGSQCYPYNRAKEP
jgi:hypothetical protein